MPADAKKRASEPWKLEDMVMTCTHVTHEGKEPDYHKEDDCYTCANCCKLRAAKGFDAVKSYLRFVHRIHLAKWIKPVEPHSHGTESVT